MFDDGGGVHRVRARFENAGQVVNGGLVQIAGERVGTITDQRLTGNGLAELTLKIDDDWAPLPARDPVPRSASSGPRARPAATWTCASGAEGGGDMPDDAGDGCGGHHGAIVDLDQIFGTFDKRTRRSIRGVIRGSARQYAGHSGTQANQGLAVTSIRRWSRPAGCSLS